MKLTISKSIFSMTLFLVFGLIAFSSSVFSAAPPDDSSRPPKTMTPENFSVPYCPSPCGCDANGLPKPSLRDGTCGTDIRQCVVRDCTGRPFDNIDDALCRMDNDRDEYITPQDASNVIEKLNDSSFNRVVTPETTHLDTNNDGRISALDALLIINWLNGSQQGRARLDECGICGGTGKDSCGSCPGDLNKIVDLGCGCGNPGPSGCDNICGSNKVSDSCGVCGGSGPGVCGCDLTLVPSGCDNVCGSTKTLDQCGVCGGDGSSCANSVCEAYSININAVDIPTARIKDIPHIGRRDVNMVLDGILISRGGVTRGIFVSGESHLQCLTNIVNTCNSRSGRVAQLECFWDQMIALGGFSSVAEVRGRRVTGFFDSDCNNISPPPSEVCGNLDFATPVGSPISLVWDESNAFAQSKIAKFALAPNTSNDIVIWKGSKSTPLLVYLDTKDSASKPVTYQNIFGHWTWGGKKTAKVDKKGEVQFAPWSDGFEALAQLDLNYDNEISGSELDNLYLWFDNNQDAMNQPGEITSLKDLGVHRLWYKNPEKIFFDGVNHLELAKGFERKLDDGKVLTGRSVDWFSPNFTSEIEAIAWFSSISSLGNLNIDKDQNIVGINEDILASDIQELEGIWEWKVKAAKGNQSDAVGFLVFKKVANKLLGFSVNEIKLKKPEDRTLFNIYTITDIEKAPHNGKDYFYFKLSGDNDETNTRFTKDGDVLKGESFMFNKQSISDKVEDTQLQYDWTATRKK
ncbi:MAG TPA: dockerin type I domain-containing protein [Oligoflexia bacterium]|nr:dockerin type I domain-containing protein [Oligoflexia bacterium]HMP47574.1 dockerin type I domain-containing protein [Oligoflexia bacterium]